MSRATIPVEELAPPAGPFSAATVGMPVVFISGQVGQDPDTGALVEGTTADQARQALRNVTAVLAAAGRTQADVLRVGVFLTDPTDLAEVNTAYAEFFTAPFPARTTVIVADLPLGAAVEIEAAAQ